MSRKQKSKLYLIIILLLMASVIGYKVFLLVYETDYQAVNADHIDRIEASLHDKAKFKFAVVGNIRNSMRIFERRIAPLIRENGADFIISAGNAVYDGTEGKYRLLYRGLNKLGLPYVLTAGLNEAEDFGAEKFYRHFGPYFFSFYLKNACFIFLDSTGQTSWKWQLKWLRQRLIEAGKYQYRFIFLGNSLFFLPGFDSDYSKYVLDKKLSRILQNLFSQYKVTAVFSASYPVYHDSMVQGVRYVISGGGGGLLLDQQEHYQFVKVNVGPDQVAFENVPAPQRLGLFREKFETLKLFLHSFFYMSIFNSLLILSMISLVALKVYEMIIRQEHLYRDFSVDEEALSESRLRVAMFTNNYLPFIGGVPLSIDRLYRRLVRLGSTVKLFAPGYPQQWTDPGDGSIFRCPTFSFNRLNNFPVANIFSRKIQTVFKAFDCDLVHVHHPFWLGKKGMRLARKDDIPVVFTYHTRLEKYTHYIPLPGMVLKNLAVHFLIKHFANRCDAIITPTSSTEEYLRNLGVSALIETIPTGISIEDYKRWSDSQVQEFRSQYVVLGERLLISVSRMAKEKNLDFLINGLEKVKERSRIPFKCLLVGDGPEKERLEQKVAALGMEDMIIFTGNMAPHEVIRCYLAADIFVFASTSETQGMVLLEAMAGGCPVVAVRASGVYDVVKDGYNGFKVLESTDSWAKAVVALLENDQLLLILSENCRPFAENYSVEKMTDKILKLYRRVVVLGKSKND
ncbi:MAG: glycosyltransferase [Desulfobacula sp.]|jgi:1,2-diacylglycerol 3-alpha-glucosyltransferase|nr:glycosyltransferase [Desulfobacula sp.]